MKLLMYITLIMSFLLIIHTFFPIGIKNKARLKKIAIVLYTCFIIFAVVFGYSQSKEDSKAVIANVNIPVKINQEEQEIEREKEQEELPIVIIWERDNEAEVNKVFYLKLKVINNMKENIADLKLNFPKQRLKDFFLVSTVFPEVNIYKANIGLGPIKQGESKDFFFELVPKKEGKFLEEIVIMINEEPLLVNNKEVTSYLEINTTGSN